MFENDHNLEERVIILRDKAAREGIDISDDVINFIAQKYSVPQALKGALINVSAFAARRRVPLTVDVARHVLEGTRLTSGEDAAQSQPVTTDISTEQPTEAETSGGHPLDNHATFAEPVIEHVAVPHEFDAPSFVQHSEPAISLEEDTEIDTLFQIGPAEESYEDILSSHTPEKAEDEALAEEPAEIAAHASTTSSDDESRASAEVTYAAYNLSTVWFVPVRTQRKKSLIQRVGTALERSGLQAVINEGDKVAIKVHFGEQGNTAFVSPLYVREVVRLVKEAGGKPFLTDANTLYSGMRDNAVDHLECAIHNGFSYATVEAPLIIADGLNSREGVDIALEGTKHFDTVRIGSAAVYADAMIVVSHVKGHGEAGFGGAFKNIGMGLGTRSAKQRMHSDIKPHVDESKCTRCKRCVSWCPAHCIEAGAEHDGRAFIRQEECIGCGECVAACAYGAININWDNDPADFQEKIVEHTLGALKGKEGKTIYLNFLMNITPECDCWSFSDAAIVPDIGVLASRDIVAIEQASYDMVTEATGNQHTCGAGMESGVDKFKAMHNIDVRVTMDYAESLGMGTRSYVLKEIG